LTDSLCTKAKRKDGSKKLAKVVSTKLSIEEDILLQQVTTVAYGDGTIKEPTKSELVRFLVTLVLYSIRQEQEKLYLLAQRSDIINAIFSNTIIY
jgi:hypothetical protein